MKEYYLRLMARHSGADDLSWRMIFFGTSFYGMGEPKQRNLSFLMNIDDRLLEPHAMDQVNRFREKPSVKLQLILRIRGISFGG